MAQFSVWVSGGEGQQRILLGDTDDGQLAAAAVGGILGLAGTHAFDVGVSVAGGVTPAPAAPAQQDKDGGEAHPAAAQPHGAMQAGGARSRGR